MVKLNIIAERDIMALALNKTIQDIQELTPSEKGFAQYLISSLDGV
jgi:hypothetical protein